MTLAANVENIKLVGTAGIEGNGNSHSNAIIGNAAANMLRGYDGNDTLDGGAGADTLVGGLGNDTFVVDSVSDVVIELVGEGTDTVQTSLQLISLPANIENLTLLGLNALNATGDAGANVLIGNGANNTLTGNAGNDTLDGDLGMDTLIGGTGDDIYRFASSTYFSPAARLFSTDRIVEAAGAANSVDTVEVAVTDTAHPSGQAMSLRFSRVGVDNGLRIEQLGSVVDFEYGYPNDDYDQALIEDFFSPTAGNQIEKVKFAGAASSRDLWGGAMVSYIWHAPSTPTSLTSTSLSEVIGFRQGADTFDGGGGDDVILGNGGNDTLRGDSGNDAIWGGDGNDTVAGGIGIDWLQGGNGTDTYLFNRSDGQDWIYDWEQDGAIDTLQFGEGIAPDQVDAVVENGDMVFKLRGGPGNALTGDTMTVAGWFGQWPGRVERIRFHDGTRWITKPDGTFDVHGPGMGPLSLRAMPANVQTMASDPISNEPMVSDRRAHSSANAYASASPNQWVQLMAEYEAALRLQLAEGFRSHVESGALSEDGRYAEVDALIAARAGAGLQGGERGQRGPNVDYTQTWADLHARLNVILAPERAETEAEPSAITKVQHATLMNHVDEDPMRTVSSVLSRRSASTVAFAVSS